MITYHLNEFLFQFSIQNISSGFEHDKTDRDLPLEVIMHPNDGALGNQWMSRYHLLHLGSRKTVPGHVDDIVNTPGDEHVAVLINISAVTGEVGLR